MGARPCPRCLVSLCDVSLLGTERDFRTRKTLVRNGNQFNVHVARKIIYRDGYTVSSAAVENLLRPNSLVPTLVCQTFIFYPVQILTTYCRMRFPVDSRRIPISPYIDYLYLT